MQFIPGHFACDVVWRTIIHIHPRLKMGPNMGVARGERNAPVLGFKHMQSFQFILQGIAV